MSFTELSCYIEWHYFYLRSTFDNEQGEMTRDLLSFISMRRFRNP